MDTTTKESEIGQVVERKATTNRKPGARVSPRSLSQLTRQLIVDEFMACGDMDAVAKAHGLPVRTVDSVLHWASFRKQPAFERRLEVIGGRKLA